jgi:hypothetical protein
MLNGAHKLENLEDSIAHVQALLDDAQNVLSAFDVARAKAEELHVAARRLTVVGAAAGVVLALGLAARRRRA